MEQEMVDTKPWYLSRTIWAALVTVAAALCGLFGLPMIEEDTEALVDLILQAVATLAGIAAILGRLDARSRIE
jgi:hypothetical protein